MHSRHRRARDIPREWVGDSEEKRKKRFRFRMHIDMPRGLSPLPFPISPFSRRGRRERRDSDVPRGHTGSGGRRERRDEGRAQLLSLGRVCGGARPKARAERAGRRGAQTCSRSCWPCKDGETAPQRAAADGSGPRRAWKRGRGAEAQGARVGRRDEGVRPTPASQGACGPGGTVLYHCTVLLARSRGHR